MTDSAHQKVTIRLMEYQHKIFKSAVADQLRSDLKRGERLEDYYKESIDYSEGQTLPLRVEVIGALPLLSPVAQDDIDNACALHAYLANLDETQASDKRLWAHLAHVPFRGYVMKRWPLPFSADETKINVGSRKKVADSILTHWFINGNDSRALRRHALARLWWATHLTVAPWEKDGEFSALKSPDRYKYTRVLLSNEDLYSQLMERTLGNVPTLRFALLEYFKTHPEKISRVYLRAIMKEINLVSGIKRLQLLTYDEVYALVSSIGDDVNVTVNN